MGADSISLVSREFGMRFLSRPDVSDFWRELGGPQRKLNENIYFASDGRMLAVYEMFGGATGMHIAIPEVYRGKEGVRFGRAAIEFAQEITGNVILARIQIDRREVSAFARLCGMIEYNRDKTHIYMRAAQCH